MHSPSNTPKKRQIVRHLAITFFFSSIGLLIPALIAMTFDIELSKILTSFIAFPLYLLIVMILYPKILGIPFGKLPSYEFSRQIGLYLPQNAVKHVLLGILLAICTLSGMLIGSVLTGKYIVDFSNITLAQTLFSTVPGVWEEVFYRGILMIILLKAIKKIEPAFGIQCILFGLAHIKAFDVWGIIDVFSVMIIAIGFTYAAYKTNCLLAGIVFHFLHDTFLFFVQIPGGEYLGLIENATFYIPLWIMVGVGCLVTKFASEKFNIAAKMELYQPHIALKRD
ncbi:MAG: CPBP family intramembrane metalloprotease [Candidatus Heimdallarchaeota archaeon]|nr:CPBP family intramembrane metalloprotease [Candidatus Heimdallarchaeota archaeon]